VLCGVSNNPRSAVFFLQRQLPNFENVTLVARQREHLREVWAIFFVAELPQKRRCFNIQEFTRCLSICIFIHICMSRSCCWTASKRRCFNIKEFTHFLSICEFIHMCMSLKNEVFQYTRIHSLLVAELPQRRSCFNIQEFTRFLTSSVVVITEYLDWNHFQYQWIGKLKKTLKSNAPQTRFLFVKKCAAGKIFL